MKITLRIPHAVWSEIHADLSQPHPYAHERVGFLTISPFTSTDLFPNVRLDALRWFHVDDANYLHNNRVGASIGPSAFRNILQAVYSEPAGILHVHRHHHRGIPAFSQVDLNSMRTFIPSFFNAQRAAMHGALLLSLDSAIGVLRTSRHSADLSINEINVHSGVRPI